MRASSPILQWTRSLSSDKRGRGQELHRIKEAVRDHGIVVFAASFVVPGVIAVGCLGAAREPPLRSKGMIPSVVIGSDGGSLYGLPTLLIIVQNMITGSGNELTISSLKPALHQKH